LDVAAAAGAAVVTAASGAEVCTAGAAVCAAGAWMGVAWAQPADIKASIANNPIKSKIFLVILPSPLMLNLDFWIATL
jgi:glycine/D-amino acid oxidase-like deaminating enzyme